MPQVFGWEHITYDVVVILCMVAGIILTKKFTKTDKQLTINVKVTALVLLLSIAFNRISIAVVSGNCLSLIPDSFCGFSSLLLALVTLFTKKDSALLHGVCYIGFIGGVITLVYPDFIGQASSIFYSKTISGLLHHTVMVYLIALMTATKYFVPTIKRWSMAFITGMFYMVCGLFMITCLGMNDAMHIKTPLLDGTPLYWYVIGGIFVVVYFGGMLIYEGIKKKVLKKNEA